MPIVKEENKLYKAAHRGYSFRVEQLSIKNYHGELAACELGDSDRFTKYWAPHFLYRIFIREFKQLPDYRFHFHLMRFYDE